MIKGKTIKKAEFTKPTEDIRSELILTFTDGTTFSVITNEQMDFYRQDSEGGRMEWIHPANVNS